MNMDRFSKAKKVQVIQILTKLTMGYQSRDNYNSNEVGFFTPDNGKKRFEMGFNNIDELPETLNNSIQLMYKIIGEPEKEVYLGCWTIMSLKEAIKQYEARDLDGAIRSCVSGLKQFPKTASLMNLMGMCQHLLGNYQEALDIFNECIRTRMAFISIRRNDRHCYTTSVVSVFSQTFPMSVAACI